MEVIKGRMYDYNNGRFLSVDPFIQSPTSTQSMNPYTYIFNNPLSGVDPTGYLVKFPGDDILKEILGPNNYRDPCARNICFGGSKEDDNGKKSGESSSEKTKIALEGITVIGTAIAADHALVGGGSAAAAAGSGSFAEFGALVLEGSLRALGVIGGLIIPSNSIPNNEEEMASMNNGQLQNSRGMENVGTPATPPPPNGDDEEDYENPGHHDPSGGANAYNRNKAVLPKNHRQIWNKSKPDPKNSNVRWAKEGTGKKAVYHIFRNNGNGKWHWSGSTKGVTRNGTPRPISSNDVPNSIKKL